MPTVLIKLLKKFMFKICMMRKNLAVLLVELKAEFYVRFGVLLAWFLLRLKVEKCSLNNL